MNGVVRFRCSTLRAIFWAADAGTAGGTGQRYPSVTVRRCFLLPAERSTSFCRFFNVRWRSVAGCCAGQTTTSPSWATRGLPFACMGAPGDLTPSQGRAAACCLHA